MVREIVTSTGPVRVAILDSDSMPVSLVDRYGPYFSVAIMNRLGNAMKKTTFSREFEFKAWDVIQGQYPDPATIDAVILTGGKSSAYWPDPWIGKLREYVVDLYNNHPHVKMVGICLGHQMIAHSLLQEHGIFVEKSPRGMQMGIRTVNLDPQFSSSFPNIQQDLKAMRLHVVHGDHVYCPPGTSLPPGWMLFGKSDCCDVHGLYQPGRVLTMQSHLEMTRAITYDIIEYLALSKGETPNPETIDALLDAIEIEDDGDVAGGFVLSFLAS